MPLYTAIRTPNNVAQAPEYKQRNIPSITAARISSLGLFSFPLEKQTAYDVYKTTISAFLYATATKTKVRTDKNGYKFTIKPEELIPFPSNPPLHFRPKIALSGSELTKWKKDIGEIIEFEELPFGKSTVFVASSPTIQQLRALTDLVTPKHPGPSNSSNVVGVKALYTWKKIITAFLSTHTYPAFQTDDEVNSRYSQDIILRIQKSGIRPDGNKKRGIDIVNLAATKRRRVGLTIEKETDEDCAQMEIDVEDDQDVEMASIVPVAKPAPFRPSLNFGPVSYVPALGGQLFPYFFNCLVPDQNCVADIMRRHFLLNFGNDPTDAAENFQDWASDFRSISNTQAGQITQHITLGVELALQAQARLFLLYDGSTYLGFTLLGYKFATMAYTEVHVALSSENLRKELGMIVTHESSLAEMCALLSDLELKDDNMKEVVNPEDIGSARQLYREISIRQRETSKSKVEKFQRAITGIFFETDYLRVNKENVVRALRLLANPVDDELDDLPLYLHRDFVFGDSIPYQVLGAFGPTAPSFVNLAGNRYDIPYTDVEDYAFSTDPTKEDSVKRILVSMKALNIAVGDMKKVRDERAIYQNFNERARANRNIEFVEGHGREEIWSALREHVAGRTPDVAAEKEVRAGPSKAKKRKVADVPDFDDF